MSDKTAFGEIPEHLQGDSLKPLNTKKNTKKNISKKSKQLTAVALEDRTLDRQVPQITAAGRGKIAEEIIRLAEENGVKIREDSTLAEMLATIEIDSPIPSEAFMAVAEILSYVYRANGQPNPFDAVIKD